MKCPHCKAKNEKGATVCHQCGEPLPEKNKDPKKGRKIVAIALTAAILFGGVGVLGWQLGWFSWLGDLFGGPAEEVIEPYMEAAEATLNENVAYFDADATEKLEDSILQTATVNNALVLTTNGNSGLEKLNEGDIFLLRGSADSAFGESYFGKIDYRYSDGDLTYYAIETPEVDEVFDNLDLDFLQLLSSENVKDFQSVEGVTLGDAPSATAQAGESGVTQVGSLSTGGITQLKASANGSSNGHGVTVGKEGNNTFFVTIEIDILKLLKKRFKENTDQIVDQQVSELGEMQAKNYTVYTTDTGLCYHRVECRYLYKSKNEMMLTDALSKGLRPCTACKPAVLEDHQYVEPELKLTGTVKLQDLAFGVYAEGKKWDESMGYDNMSIRTAGDLIANVKLDGNVKLQFEQDDTKLVVESIFGNPLLTLSGLKEKMLPIAYLTWECGTFAITDVPDSTDLLNAPLSVGILLYTDLQGNISFGVELGCTYTKPIDFEFDVFKNGKFLGVGEEKDIVTDPKDTEGSWDFDLKAEISADVDFQALGASMMLYVANVNIFELSIAKVGVSVHGAIGFDLDKVKDENYGFYAEGKVRAYLKMLEINVKAKAEGFGQELERGGTAGPLVNLTLWQLRKQTERDIVLVLDVSGSMDGTPLEEAKKAAVQFIRTVMEKDSSVAIVTYDSDARVVSEFSDDEQALVDAVSGIYTGGMTNMDAGLREAEILLTESQAKKKSLILLSDGLPNEGRVGDELISYAQSIKDQNVYLYTLGFFDGLYSSDKQQAQSLMEAIASEGLHYEVSSAEDLVFFFEDLADQINGQKYIYIRIACPVDVTVKYKGERLCSKDSKLNTRTDFGTLTFEENEEEPEDEDSDNRIKVLRLKEGVDYEIQIEGNGRGRMNYSIGFMDENGEYSDMREFRRIKITRRTEINTVAAPDKETYLYVDEDGDGKTDLTYKATADSRGRIVEEMSTGMILLIVCTCVLATGGAAVGVFFWIKKKKQKNAVST